MNLNSVLIGSGNPAGLIAYYRMLFGEPEMADQGFAAWRIGNGGLIVGPHDQVHGTNPDPGRVIWNLESEDVKADFDRLRAAGASVVREPYQPDQAPQGWIATLADPDGNYFQLMSPIAS